MKTIPVRGMDMPFEVSDAIETLAAFVLRTSKVTTDAKILQKAGLGPILGALPQWGLAAMPYQGSA